MSKLSMPLPKTQQEALRLLIGEMQALRETIAAYLEWQKQITEQTAKQLTEFQEAVKADLKRAMED